MNLQNLKQGDFSVSAYLNKAKGYAAELANPSRPFSLADLNIYIFKGKRQEFKDLVATLAARPDLATFSKLQSQLLSHKFIHTNSMATLTLSPSTKDNSSSTPSTNLSQHSQYNGNHGGNPSGRGCG